MEYILFSIASYVVYGGFLGFCHLGVLRRFLLPAPLLALPHRRFLHVQRRLFHDRLGGGQQTCC